MSKNLTFKLIMDGDSKGLVAAAKQSESVTKKVFETIKVEAEQLKEASTEATKGISGLGDQSSETVKQIDKLDSELGEVNTELQKTESLSQQVGGEIQGLKTGFTALTSALAALGIGTTTMELANTADEFKNLSGRIRIAIGDHGDLEKSMTDVKNVAVATNSDLTATGDLNRTGFVGESIF